MSVEETKKPRGKTEPVKVSEFIAACKKATDREEVIEALGITGVTFGKYYKIYREKREIPELDARVVFTPEILDKLRVCFKKGYTDKEACYEAKVKLSSFYSYCSRNEDFREEKEILKRNPYNLAKDIIVEELEAKNVDIAKLVWKEDKMSERASKL